MKTLLLGTPWYMHLAMIVSSLLGIVSFFIPPYAVIDGSVLAYAGELIGGATLMHFVAHIPVYLEKGIKAKVSHGNTTLTVAADEVEETAEEL
jgi:hypothetical protein